MLDEHRCLLLDTNGGKPIELEVNWNPDDPETNECKRIRLCFTTARGERERVVISRDNLLTLMLVMGDAHTQKKLLPVQLNRIRKIERLLTFTYEAQKDYRKGDKITVQAPWIDTVPDVEQVFLDNLKKNVDKKSKLIT